MGPFTSRRLFQSLSHVRVQRGPLLRRNYKTRGKKIATLSRREDNKTMAESAVNFLVEKISFLLEKEVKLLTGFREEVVSVKAELESMSAFLRAADAAEDEDEEIEVWVKQVREVAYDAEDILDEYLYRFAEQHQRGRGFYGRLYKIARTVRTLKAGRHIASEFQSIKSRVTEISNRRQRYRYRSNIILEEGSSSSTPRNNAWQERRSDARLLQESQLVGIGERKQGLVNWLLEGQPSSLQLVAVVGMGGLGKTTLVNQVYIDAIVKEFFHHRAWITVSQFYSPCELLKKIIQQLFDGIKQPLPQGAYSSDRYNLSQIIQNFLSEKRYLVVLDDVWDVNAWNDLKYAFPNNNLGSRLILTTRIVDVASTATKDLRGDNIYSLEALSPEDSWNLFCARTFQGEPCPLHLVEISRAILRRCMGLPLAIVTISGVLATKDMSKLNEWERISRHLGFEFDNNDKLKIMKRILLLSFNDLSYRLKSCFLYLSLFAEDYRFLKGFIIQLWAAEGFVQEMGDMTPEEVGEVYFNELCNRSLIQKAVEDAYEKLNRFQVHDLVREIILQKSKDINFSATVDEQNPRLRERVRHLSVSTTLPENFRGDCNFSGLRTLLFLVNENSNFSNAMQTCFSKYDELKLLKVLSCAGLRLDVFPEPITQLYNLKYLCISHTQVASIPRSIGRLRSLEALDLEQTFVTKLPVEILQLHSLRHLVVFHTINDNSMFGKDIGASVPADIGKLAFLQFLNLIQACHGDLDLIRSLGRLKQLRVLRIQQLGAEHGPALCSVIQNLSLLNDLFMETREETEILDVQDISLPPPRLQRLSMHGRLENLPHWVPKLSSLAVLELRWSKLQLDPLESLQVLPNLVHLVLADACDAEELCIKSGGFKMLKELVLNCLGRLRQVTVELGAMPHLQRLWLEDCKSLEEVPSGVESLTNLKELTIINMGDQLLARLSSSSQNSDLSRVQHVPRIYVGSRDAEGLQGDFL